MFLAQLLHDAWSLPPSVNRSRTLAYLVTVQREIIFQAHNEAVYAADKEWEHRPDPIDRHVPE